jgi:hypothetical protein
MRLLSLYDNPYVDGSRNLDDAPHQIDSLSANSSPGVSAEESITTLSGYMRVAQVDSLVSPAVPHTSRSSQEPKKQPYSLELPGWPVKPRPLKTSFQTRLLQTTGDVILLIFPVLVLGMKISKPGSSKQ